MASEPVAVRVTTFPDEATPMVEIWFKETSDHHGEIYPYQRLNQPDMPSFTPLSEDSGISREWLAKLDTGTMWTFLRVDRDQEESDATE